MDTDARESHPTARNRAARSAALWATPLSILAGAISVSWSRSSAEDAGAFLAYVRRFLAYVRQATGCAGQ